MKTLEEVQAQFESKNRAGQEVHILAYHPEQKYPVIAEYRDSEGWRASEFSESGLRYIGGEDGTDLIEKRPVLPKDILCEVWGDSGKKICKRYSTGDGLFYNKGATSLTYEVGRFKWDNFRVIENPPQPWFGGECPIPEGCKFRVRVNGRWLDGANHIWVWSIIDYTRANITAYQILGGVGDD